MWLASASMRNASGEVVGAPRWGHGVNLTAEKLIDEALAGVGDASMERCFRMPVTLCRHRALTDAEAAALPQWWHDAPAIDIAGPLLEVVWSRGIKESPTLQPCAEPGRQPIPGSKQSDLYLIVPCERCASCLARAAV